MEKEKKEDGMIVDKETEVEKKEGELTMGEGKRRRSYKRSEEALERRRAISKGKLKRKHQAKIPLLVCALDLQVGL